MLLCLTANHRNASFDVLEKLSIVAPQAAHTLVSSSDIVNGAVVLATCNRFEAYLEVDTAAHGAGAVDSTIEAMSAASGVRADELRQTVTVLSADEVPRHLFAVSSGLESVVVGEDEISGQVARALERARTDGTSSRGLERLFQKASHTSRGVKTQTALGVAGRSLVRLGLELASSRIADWGSTRVLLVGTGQYAATTLTALRDRGAHDIRVFSPSGRAARFATKYGVRAETELARGIAASDVVITCTASTAPVVTAAHVSSGRRIVIDLGLPRNVDPGVAQIDGVELLDLETISIHAPLAELNAHDDARAIVGDAAAAFAAEQSVNPSIVALRDHIFGILDAEIERARQRGDSSEQTERALRHLVSVLVHTPSARARELAIEGRADDFVAGVEALYGIRSQLGSPAAEVERGTA